MVSLQFVGGRVTSCCNCSYFAFASNKIQCILYAMLRAGGPHCAQDDYLLPPEVPQRVRRQRLLRALAGECDRITLTNMHTHTHMRTWHMNTQMHALRTCTRSGTCTCARRT
eukprot:6211783-Pleurochrysis_carterae.AAC.1